MNSCIYNGLVTHHRFKPVKHELKYKTFSLLIDLDELELLDTKTVSYTHLRAHETKANLVCRLLLEK